MDEKKRLFTAQKIYSNTLKDPVRIRPIELDTLPPKSVPVMFDQICRQLPMRAALNYKENGIWQKITYREYRAMVRCCAKGFLTLGLLPNSVVCILGFNSPEWFISDLGAIYAGGVAAGIYTTNSAEACLYCLNHCNAKIIVVENTQVSKILQIKSQAKSIIAIIQYGGEPFGPDVLPWEKFMKIGETIPDSLLDKARRTINVNQCCTLVYTSGTTGNPKGAMLSHDNVIYDALKIGEKIGLTKYSHEVYVSYLPLSHVAGNIVDIHCCFIFGVKVFFAEKDALRGSLVNTFQEVRPTRVLSVPRVWEKIYEKFQEKAAQTTGIKKMLAKWAKKQGLKKNLALEKKGSYSFLYHLANIIVFKKVKRLLGVDRCKTIISGAAPLSYDIKLYFASLDILILEGYGMSESSALHCCCVSDSFRFDSCGTTCNGMITYIDNPDEDGNGELCLYGRHIFMGYLDDEEKTLETLDDRGYLHSGDIARIDEDGFIYITGRIKDLIITAGGENVAPTVIESNIKNALPFLGYVVLVGDRRKFLAALLTLSCEGKTGEKGNAGFCQLKKVEFSQINYGNGEGEPCKAAKKNYFHKSFGKMMSDNSPDNGGPAIDVIIAGNSNSDPERLRFRSLFIKRYNICLFVPGHEKIMIQGLHSLKNSTVNDYQEPTDVLMGNVQNWLSKLGFNYRTMGEVMRSGPHRKILESIQAGIDEANDKAISNAQKVQKFVILPQDFSIATGELGPTMKVKRKVVSEKYENYIDRMYKPAATGPVA